MDTMRLDSRRIFYIAAVFIMLVALVLPVIASAATVTQRSVTLSNSSKATENVTYEVEFTPATDAGAFLIDFCSNSPLIGQECTAPGGFSASDAATSTPGFTMGTKTANRVVVEGTITQPTPVTVAISGIDNPTAAGPLYARIVTFDTAANATSSTPQVLGSGARDEGGIAISITDTIGVSGTVLESLTFCASRVAIPDNCVTTTSPTVELGEEVGDIKALTAGVISEGSTFVQISTNASNGAVIRLKSSAANCGGLIRAGDPTECDILPALNGGIDAQANEAKFGVKTTTATDTPGENVNATGSLVPANGSIYNNTNFALNYVDNNEGVTSTFGDPFLDTAGEPVTSKNMELVFGATVANNTPAGSYSADLSLIAVGKF